MDGGRAQAGKGFLVTRRSVPFVVFQVVPWVLLRQLDHQAVPGDLSHDGGRSDGEDVGIPMRYRLLGDGEPGQAQVVQKEAIWGMGEFLDGPNWSTSAGVAKPTPTHRAAA